VALVVLSPYLVMLCTAAKPESELRATPPRLTPVQWRPGNFLEVLADPSFQAWLRASLVVALTSTVIVVLAATPGGLLHRAAPVPPAARRSSCSCSSRRCSRRRRWWSGSTVSSSSSA